MDPRAGWEGRFWLRMACAFVVWGLASGAVPSSQAQPVETKGSYDARPTESGTTGEAPSPIDASGAQPLEAVAAAGVGAKDTPPPPTPLDSDGDGYYNYAEDIELGGGAAGDPNVYPQDPSPTVNTRHHPAYLEAVKKGYGWGRWYIARPTALARPHTAARVAKKPSRGPRQSPKNAIARHPYVAAGAVVATSVVVALAASGGGGSENPGGSGGGNGGSAGPDVASFEGTLPGRWTGKVYEEPASGTLTAHISRQGTVSGSYEGLWRRPYPGGFDEVVIRGELAGQVDVSGNLQARGSAGNFEWNGRVQRVGGALQGTGTWRGDAGSGTWIAP